MNPDHKIDSRVENAAQCFARAMKFAKEGKIEETLIELGHGMHALQDIYAHGDYSPTYHVVSEIPQSIAAGEMYNWLDDPYMEDANTPTVGLSERAQSAIALTQSVLEEFLSSYQKWYDSTPVD